ncbi:MAG: hypothetical protein SPK08_02430 [Candidatus Cryptobacteroides sp.]|nr:hypothetical protein [Rikenellaceae bacterium]MDY5746381.1 hypothetical protein [Candidatus Cryptobacteroides sp.]
MGYLDDNYDRSSRLNRSLGVEPTQRVVQEESAAAGAAGAGGVDAAGGAADSEDYGQLICEGERFRYLCLAVGNAVEYLLSKGKKKEASGMASLLHATYPCAESKELLNKCLFAD